MVNPAGNSLPFALQNVICILLLEITKFLRESYQYMPKKITNTSALKHHEIYRDQTSKITRDNRTNITTENFSGATQSVVLSKGDVTVPNQNSKRNSTDNVSLSVNAAPDYIENSKHISFAVTEPNKDDQGSLNSGKLQNSTAAASSPSS